MIGKMRTKLKTSAFTEKERNCSFTLTLDKRTNRKDCVSYPLSVRFTVDRKLFYVHVGSSYSEQEFSDIVSLSPHGRSDKLKLQRQWKDIVMKYKELLTRLNPGKDLSFDFVKAVVTGENTEEGVSFIGVWEQMLEDLKKQGRFTTAESYGCALKSFKKVLWKHPVKGFEINVDVLKEWEYGMLHGVMGADGKMTKPIAEATTGIYKRACRVVWNECLKRGYLTNVQYPFSNKIGTGLVYIPRGATRKDRYLSVDKMTELYNLFLNPVYPESWTKDYQQRAHQSLGLFLVQYLCNGFNLADAALLKYNQYYFSSDKKAFRFERKKTAERSSENSEVVVPIIEPLQHILDEIAAEPKLDTYVFPWILNGATSAKDIRSRTSQENSNVKDRVTRICKEVLGWEIEVSGTWCRHSFATNLRNAGVDMDYISESMGHSMQDHSVTQLYIEHYPLQKQMEYNSLLLNVGREKKDKKDELLSQLSSLSAEELQRLLAVVKK